MTKFKKGDWVRVRPGVNTGIGLEPARRVSMSGFSYPWGSENETNGMAINDDWLELVTKGGEMKPYQRKTYRLKKDAPDVRKGALFQERCDDGTQPYDLLTPEFLRSGRKRGICFSERSDVEDQPQWFEEVFKVEPEYMTREELDKWEAFKGKKKPGRKPAAKVAPATTAKRRKKRGESARRSVAAKAAWARRKAAQAGRLDG